MRGFSTLICAAAVAAAGCTATATTQFKPVTFKATAPKVEVKVKEVVERERIEISDKIHFAVKSARLVGDSERILDEVVATLAERPEIMVEIQGHTDAQGSDRNNQRLSARRAASVKRYLVKQGVNPRRLVIVGHGEEQPVADNSTREGREMNRRVEFIILDQQFDENLDDTQASDDTSDDDEVMNDA